MDNDLYKNALSAFNRGEYETAYNIISCSEESLSSESERLLNECKKQIAEQYYYIIKEYLQQGDYNTAQRQKEEYTETYGYNPKIESIEIPAKSMFSLSMEDSTEVSNGNKEKKSALKNIGLIVGIIAVILIIMIVVWQCTKDEDVVPTLLHEEEVAFIQETSKSETEIYQERSDAAIAQLVAEYGDKIKIIGKYPELSQYSVGYIENYSPESFHCIVVCDIKAQDIKYYNLKDGDTILKYPIKVWEAGNKLLLIIQENNYVEVNERISYTLSRIDPSNWELSEINAGHDMRVEDDRVIVSRYGIASVDENCNYSYCNIDVYHDLNGNIIKPKLRKDTYKLKGLINDKYAITMQLSIQNDKIYGRYFYDKTGSNNYLYLYGGVSESGDVVLLEFNNDGKQTGNFTGRFTTDSFYGKFMNYEQVLMPVELHLNNGTSKANSSQAISGNSKPIADNDVAEEDIPVYDRDPEFPGGMSNLRKYISENVEYPAISQENGIAGQVKVSYIINEDGSISDVEVIESVDPYLDKEAIRVISLMPKWNPGIRDGKFVKMKTSTYVKFNLH